MKCTHYEHDAVMIRVLLISYARLFQSPGSKRSPYPGTYSFLRVALAAVALNEIRSDHFIRKPLGEHENSN